MKKALITPLYSVFVLGMIFGFSPSAHALTISPARLELSGDPGQTISGDFVLINEQENTKTFYSSAENFEAQGENGTPTFIISKEGLASWIKVLPQITLKKGEQERVHFTVTIPKDADSGGHFAAIFLSTAPTTGDGGQVSVGAKIGVLILLRVSGDIKEGGGIIDLSTTGQKSFFASLPVSFIYRFNNSGNDRVNPTGYMVVTNTLGFKTATLSGNPLQGNVLPGSTRRFGIVWGGEAVESTGFFSTMAYEWSHFALGKYTAHLSLKYGTSGTSEAFKTIFIFPWQLLLVLIIILSILFILGFQGIKRYNRWIIKKAQ